jgi:hypothetical protein
MTAVLVAITVVVVLAIVVCLIGDLVNGPR